MKTLTFKADDKYEKRLKRLQKKLEIDRSKVIRLAIDELYNTIMDPEKKPGDLVLADGYEYRLAVQSGELANEVLNTLDEISMNLDATVDDTLTMWYNALKIHKGSYEIFGLKLRKAQELLKKGGGESDENVE